MKYNYMMALQDRFFRVSECEDLRLEIETNCKKLRQTMSKEDRRCLMRIIDAEVALCDRISLDSFASGFKLASGIAKELTSDGLYSFAAEEEKRIIQELEDRQDERCKEGVYSDDDSIP